MNNKIINKNKTFVILQLKLAVRLIPIKHFDLNLSWKPAKTTNKNVHVGPFIPNVFYPSLQCIVTISLTNVSQAAQYYYYIKSK